MSTGLSILIPAYNFYPSELIESLYNQTIELQIPFEILCFDDGEGELKQFQNKEEKFKEKVCYKVNSTNLQRRGNRDALAQAAQYDRILFLDHDALINIDFLQKWAEHLEESYVVCGGVAYRAEGNHTQSLRYLYGKKVEQKSASERNQNPYSHFTCFNLLINKDLYLKMPIYKEIQGYGHEDTMMGRDLKYAFAEIKHIDNPAFHTVQDSNLEFIEKTKVAVENMARLIAFGHIDEDFRLFATYSKLSAFRPFLASFFSLSKNYMIDNLTSKKPSLFVFNLFKLSYLAYINPATIKEKGKI